MIAAMEMRKKANVPWPSTACRISSLLQKPASGNSPARANEPMRKVAAVMGIFRHNPPSWPISWWWCVPMMTAPAPRNSSALKKACVNRWNMPALTYPAPRATNMNPNWLTVE